MTASTRTVKALCVVASSAPRTLGDALTQVGCVAAAWPRLSASQRHRVRVAAVGYAGLLDQRKARSTGATVSLYDGEAAGLDTEGGPYSTVCEDHAACVAHATLAIARSWLSMPEEWCDSCQSLRNRGRTVKKPEQRTIVRAMGLTLDFTPPSRKGAT